MERAIETRELIALRSLDTTIPGTFHRACDGGHPMYGNGNSRERIGVLFLNSLTPTRAARGDSSVSWADSFAELGYPSFRIDLPGFGDSATDPPADLLNFVNLGGYTRIACAVIKALVAQYHLSGVVLFGLCAGAVSAIYTAADSKECLGLILLDPYFHLPQANGSTVFNRLMNQIPPGALRRGIRGIVHGTRAVRERQLRKQLPETSNFRLLDRWKTVMSSGLPIIMFTAPAIKQKGVEFDYVDYLRTQLSDESQVEIKAVQGADHTFANCLGRSVVRQQTEEWLNTHFPPVTSRV
jgi:pimeloyl-ACP methyl ester carboxylesterase